MWQDCVLSCEHYNLQLDREKGAHPAQTAQIRTDERVKPMWSRACMPSSMKAAIGVSSMCASRSCILTGLASCYQRPQLAKEEGWGGVRL